MKRILAFLLFLVVLSGSLIACVGGETSTEESTNPNTETKDGGDSGSTSETEPEDVLKLLEKKDYDGYEFIFYTRECCNHANNLYAEAEANDAVSVANYNRNLKVQEYLNMEIVEPITAPDGNCVTLIDALKANDDVCDAIHWHFKFLGEMATTGLLRKMSDLPYFSFEEDWWATDLIENYSIAGNVYVAQGEYCSDTVTDMGCLAFNRRIQRDSLSDVDFFQLVRDHEWTLDKMITYAKQIGEDSNKDSVIDENDTFGFNTSAQHLFQFMYSSNQHTTAKNEDGIPELVLNTEKMYDLVEKVYGLICDNPYTYCPEVNDIHIFTEGRALFSSYCFYDITYEITRDMEDGFGILPYPKYDESQEEYYSRMISHASLLGLPYNLEKPERSAHIMEAMAREGYQTVRPAIYETALKTKYTDTDSWEMMDIIMAGSTSDFADIYDNFNLAYTLDTLIGRHKWDDFGSFYAMYESIEITTLQKAIDKLTAIDNE